MIVDLNTEYLQTKYGLTADEVDDFPLILDTYKIRERLRVDIDNEKEVLKMKRRMGTALLKITK